MQFNIEQYSGNFAMHCKTREDAEIFLSALAESGRSWGSGKSYKRISYYDNYKEQTCYAFNIGQFGQIDTYVDLGFTILEFDSFDWSDAVNPTENDIKIMDKFFSGFAIN